MWGCHIKQVKLADDLLPQHWTGGVVQRSNKDDMMVVVENTGLFATSYRDRMIPSRRQITVEQ